MLKRVRGNDPQPSIYTSLKETPMELSGSLRRLRESRNAKWNLPEAYGSFRKQLDQYGTLRKLVEASGNY